jgi:3-oxoacyl-[acyl-carrier protein] reductase
MTDRILSTAKVRAEREGRTIDEIIAADAAQIPMGRLGEPEEFGRVVTFFASPAASYVTGVTVQVDGGNVRGLM